MNFFKILSKGLLWLLDALPKRKEEDKSKYINKKISKEKSSESKKQEILKTTKVVSQKKSKIKTKAKSDNPKLGIKKDTNINEKTSKNKIQKNDIIEIKPKEKDEDNELKILEVKTPGTQSLKSEEIPKKIIPIKVENKNVKEEKEKDNILNIEIEEEFSININSAIEQREEDLETRTLLGEIFKQEDQAENDNMAAKIDEENSPYYSYINELIELINNHLNGNEYILRKVFEDFATEKKLMINALIDCINEYSLANFDELLIDEEEDNDTLFIDLELLAKIRKTKTF